MCSTPSTPAVASTADKEQVAAPTYADASVSKSSTSTRNKTAALAGRDIKTSARGLGDDAATSKKELLGA
ncbi:MAG: hypothetical protein PHV37_09075 [Candidatus Gastranaerophilales bacterium]|nr:hypothetical protein [Candidatus Gastranaerophilales bacterium]